LKVAVYTRVSTEEQSAEDRYGMRSQMTDIRRLCSSRRYQVVQAYSDTVSGATSNRPGFQQMLSDAKNHLFEAIVVAKLDRLARSLVLQLVTTDELQKLGVQVISVAEPLGEQDQDTARLIRSVMGAFSEFERSRINTRMSGGRREKAKTGGFSGGPPQYGYVSQDHKLVIDEDQANVVRKIFVLRAQRWALQEIADKLNETSTTRRGKAWQPRQVSRILEHRSLYRGRYAYAKTETKGLQEAILR